MTPIADPTDDPTGAPDGPDNPGGHHTPARLAAAGGRDQPEGASGRGNNGGVDLAGALTWAEVAAQAVDDLRRSGHEGPDIDVRRIIEEVTGADGAAYPRVLN